MRISGTDTSSVILSQTCCIKKLKSSDQQVPKQAEAKSKAQKVPKQAKAKRDGVINPQNYNLNQFKHRKV